MGTEELYCTVCHEWVAADPDACKCPRCSHWDCLSYEA